MNLRQCEHKKVRIVDKDGKKYKGYVGDYIWADDNENNLESIIVDFPDGSVAEFYEKDIELIEILGE